MSVPRGGRLRHAHLHITDGFKKSKWHWARAPALPGRFAVVQSQIFYSAGLIAALAGSISHQPLSMAMDLSIKIFEMRVRGRA